MRVVASWLLATAAVAVGGWRWGWPGVLLGTTVVVFWLLLQFSRSLRVLKNAGSAPVGSVANAVMLHARLKPGLTLMQILPLTGSLGRKLEGPHEHFRWQDGAGDGVELTLVNGRVTQWQLTRVQPPAPGPADAAP